MNLLYSNSSKYTIRALAYIAACREERNFSAVEVCKRAEIPEAYTRKTFQALVQGGFLKAITGPGGGYALVKAPDEITILEIVEAVEGGEALSGCVLGFPRCDESKPCSLHETWLKLKKQMLKELFSKTLEDLVKTMNSRASKKSGRKK